MGAMVKGKGPTLRQEPREADYSGDQETHTQRVLGALPWSELVAGMEMHDRRRVPRPPSSSLVLLLLGFISDERTRALHLPRVCS